MTQHFAVFGQPIAHSLSPRIHAAFARQQGIPIDYTAIEAAPENFSYALDNFHALGGRGANITLPHKQAAFAHCENTSARAQRAGAVNTLIRTDTGWDGDNTDGPGLIHDLTERHRIDLRGRRTLLLGAGGAARGVAPALLDAGIGELFVVNRTAGRADTLADAVGQPGRVHPRYWEDLKDLGSFDFIINATSAGRGASSTALPFSLVSKRTLAVDLSYSEAAIAFMSWAKAANAEVVLDGLGMLVEQAAISFSIWHGMRPETDVIYENLRKEVLGLHNGD
ncbi:MAG: shikimate dehydrogenase [Arenimonas sp.]